MKPTNVKLSEQFVDFIDLADKDLEEISIPELGRVQGGWGFSCGGCRGFRRGWGFSCESCESCEGFSCESCEGFSCESCEGFSCGSCWGFGCGSCF